MHVCNSISLWVLILSHELKKSAERPGQRYGFSARRLCFLFPEDGCLLVSICLQFCALQVGLTCWSCYHYWTLLDTGQEKITSGPGSMLLSGLLSSWLWIRYRRREKEMIIAVSCVHWLKVFWIHDLVSPGLKLRCVRIADKSCDLCCDQQDLLLIVWTNTFAVIVI